MILPIILPPYLGGTTAFPKEPKWRAGKPPYVLELISDPDQLTAVATDTRLGVDVPQFGLDRKCDFIMMDRAIRIISLGGEAVCITGKVHDHRTSLVDAQDQGPAPQRLHQAAKTNSLYGV